MDLQNLTQVRFAGEAIAKIVMEKCSAEPKALAATVSLLDSTEDLRLSIDYRNKLIAEFRDDLPGSHKEIIEFYLGVPSETAVDERLKSNIIALSRQVDDCIFFSKFLADELVKYGNSLHRRYRLRYRLGLKMMEPADWTKAQQVNLVPSDAEYRDWTSGFR